MTVHGENWNAADELARRLVAEDPTVEYVSPYDNPLLWAGHSTVVDELVHDLGASPPSHVIASVGGGGLLCGILEGLERHSDGWAKEVTVVAAETLGAASFHGAWDGNSGDRNFRLGGITSVATSLGALQVTPAALAGAEARAANGLFQSVSCTDAEAVRACLSLAQDHRLLVEPACGAALAVVYSPRLRDALLDGATSVVVEVCGVSAVSLELLEMWAKDLELE